MSEKETFVCKKCNIRCKLIALIHMEDDWPKYCPFGVLPTGGYENEPKWGKKVKK